MTHYIHFIEIRIKNDSPSFIICTSDPIGEQKVIVHTHASLTAGARSLMAWKAEGYAKVLQITASSSSTHLYEILMPLMIVSSGTLVLLSPEDSLNLTRICETIKDKQITILFINPTLLKILLHYIELNNGQNNETFERVRILCILDESLEVQHLTKIKSFFPHTRIFFIFDMAEANAAIGREITESAAELAELNTLPIGCPLTGYKCLLVDEINDGRVISPLDMNQIGQMYLAGTISCIWKTIMNCYHSHNSRCWSFSVLF